MSPEMKLVLRLSFLLGILVLLTAGSCNNVKITMYNNDTGLPIHILKEGESYDESLNKILPGETRSASVKPDRTNPTHTFTAGRNGSAITTAICDLYVTTAQTYSSVEVYWNGSTLTCCYNGACN